MNAPSAVSRDLTTWVSGESVRTIDGQLPGPVVAPTQPTSLGRYHVTRTLGVGGMGVVYEARSDDGPEPVALKTLLRLSPSGLLGFKQEFRRTASLSHPNLVSLYELSQERGIWFFSMELIQGQHLLEYVWEGKTFPGPDIAVRRLSWVLPQLLDALSFLHDNDVLHLDIKPSNVLVTKHGTVKLLDFGLSRVDGGAATSPQEAVFAGTPGYMAPEQVWGTLSKACDYYALGVTLFEVVTGRLPYVGPVNTALLAKTREAAPKVRTIEAGVPEQLATLIDALLERDPAQRASSSQLRDALGSSAAVSHRRARSLPRATELFGREQELARLDALFARSRDNTVICRLIGDSGVGKSSLLSEAMRRWQAHGALVLDSRCYQWEAIPFKAADSLIDQLYDYASSRAEPLQLPEDLALATRMFPVLEGLPFGRQPERPVDPNAERVRASQALGKLVASIARERPVVLCVDDSHWGDAESADLIGQLVDVVSQGLFVVLGMRPAGDDPHAFPNRVTTLARRGERVDVELGSLRWSDALSLAKAMAGDEAWTEEQLRSITEDAEGIPIFIEQVARFGSRMGSRPPTMAEVIDAHYGQLHPSERQLLDMVVIAGRPTRLRQILSALGGVRGVHKVLASLQSINFVRSEGLDETAFIDAYHDRVRQVALSQLTPARQRELHSALAARLEADGESPGRIAEHWHQAGELVKAAVCALDAARQAYDALAFERSSDLYARAFEWDPELTLRQPELLQGYAWATYRAGNCRKAGETFARAAELTAGDDRLTLRGHAVEALLVAGQVDRGDRVLRQLLSDMAIRAVMRAPWNLLQLVVLIALVRWRTRRYPRLGEVDQAALKKANITWDAGKALTNLLPIDGIVLLLRSLLFALQSRDPATIARGLCIAASGYVPFLERRSEHLLAVSERIAEELKDPYLRGILAVTRSTVGHMSGRWSEILREVELAHSHLSAAKVPTSWELSLLSVNAGVGLEHLGDLRRLGDHGATHATAAQRRGDLTAYVAAISDVGLAQAAANDLDGLSETIRDTERVLKSWTAGYGVWHCTLWRMKLLYALRTADFERAEELHRAEWPLIVDALLLETRALRSLALECKAAVVLGRVARERHGARRWLRAARALIRQVEPTARTDARPFAELLRAALATTEARSADALSHLANAERLFEHAEMRERACSTRWRMALQRGDDAARVREERLAETFGVLDMQSWARFRTPGFD